MSIIVVMSAVLILDALAGAVMAVESALPASGSLKASDPEPSDGAEGVISPLLEWKSGETAKFHDVYLGTDQVAITNATSSDPMGPAEVYKIRHGHAMWWELAPWIPGATYYWRIDEVEADGKTIHTGDVWSFTVAPRTAYNPDPPDGARYVETDVDLSWSEGSTAVIHDVYFGTSQSDVAHGTGGTFRGNQPDRTYDPGTLAMGTTYYWRIDEVEHDNTTKHKGEVWSFTTISPGPVELGITGPAEVFEQSSAQYNAVAYYADGSTKDVTVEAIWSVHSPGCASIDENGLLTTEDVDEVEAITIYTAYTEGEITVHAEKVVSCVPRIVEERTYYVNVLSGSDLNDGLSPEAAFATIQKGIDSTRDGDTVIVYSGTYGENISFGGKNITLSSTAPDNPDVVAATIISGRAAGPVVTFDSGEGVDCCLKGFSIINGRGGQGAGVLARGASPILMHCTIRGNEAKFEGGGMYCVAASPTLTSCRFSGNSADKGGAIYCCEASRLTLEDCEITENSAGLGGGMYSGFRSLSLLTNCTFSANSADTGGGMLNDNSDATLANCLFAKNLATGVGGGMFNGGNDAHLTSCTFENNSAEWGGGIMCEPSDSLTIINCKITQNSAEFGGGIDSAPNKITISNSYITKNSARIGGGIRTECADLRITNSVVSENTAAEYGGAIFASAGIDTSLVANNCTFVQNTAIQGQTLACDGGNTAVTVANSILWNGGEEVWLNDDSTIVIAYSDVQGSWPGEGNIDADPLLAPDGCHLGPDSPCIDAGDPAGDYSGQTDIDGEPRIMAGRVDIGADESPYERPTIYYVDALSGSDLNDGLTPETAFASIQKGVDSATDGDTVIVADGTYAGKGNRNINLKGKAITLRSENGAESCIIDCLRAGRGFYFGHNEDADTVVEGFTVMNGVADNGGGVYCSSSPTISHCIIRLNEAKHGAGLAIRDFAEPTIDNCLICENFCTGFGGGGIDCHNASPAIINCTIADNSTEGEGGAIAARGNSYPILTNCILWADTPYETSLAGEALASVTYCDVQGGWPGQGNIDADPRFAEMGEGLVSHWKFDEGEGDVAYDSAGDNHGMVYGAEWTAGQENGALDFDGYEDYVTLADDSFDDLGSNVTFSAWVYRNETGSKHYTILGYGDSDSDHWFFYLPIVDDVIAYALRKGRGSYDDCWYRGSTHIGAHEWYHIVVVTSSTGTAAYINGQKDTFTKQAISECPVVYGFPDIQANAETATIGILIRLSGTVHPFDGKIDELMIFNRALSAGEVQQLYQDSMAAPVAHWKFDEAEGQTAYDSVGDNHGTVHGAEWTAGRIEDALDFDGVDDYVDVPAPLEIGLGKSYAASAWINVPDILSTYGVITAYRHQATPSVAFQLDRAGSDVRFIVRDEAANIAAATYFEALTTDGWCHVVGVRESNDLDIYVNGVEGTSSSNTFGQIIPNDLKIGAVECCELGIHHHFNGSIDDVRIFNQALSVEEVQSLCRPSLRSKRAGYRLSPDSPCIDAGDPEYQPEPDDKDINGNPRVTGDAIDMGAFESQPLIEVAIDKFLFEGVVGYPNPPDQVLLLHNAGAGTLNWQITCDCSWLEVDPNSGRSKGYGNMSWLRVDTTGLAAGEYDCEVTISAPFVMNSPHIVKVSLIVRKNCFPDTADYAQQYADFLQYAAHGADPSCWCASPWDGTHYQCDGDASGKHQTFTKYRVFGDDLAPLINNWRRKIDTADPCADFDHKSESFLNYRVFGNDLAILIANWKKRDADLPGDCPRPDGQ